MTAQKVIADFVDHHAPFIVGSDFAEKVITALSDAGYTIEPIDFVFVLHDSEQLDLTRAQADAAEAAGLIYKPEPDVNSHYYTCPWDGSLDAVEAFLKGLQS